MDCPYIQDKLKEHTFDAYDEFLEGHLSYWKYITSIFLYLKSKGRFSFKENGQIRDNMKIDKLKKLYELL
jgi:hypothetical protein